MSSAEQTGETATIRIRCGRAGIVSVYVSRTETAIDLVIEGGSGYEDARALCETVTRPVSDCLAAGVWTWDEVIASWRGTRFAPSGVAEIPGCETGIVSSPLDAAARWMEARR